MIRIFNVYTCGLEWHIHSFIRLIVRRTYVHDIIYFKFNLLNAF